MKHICIIGTGQIGSRHLQALKSVSIPVVIHLVDPSKDSLETALSRYKDYQGRANKHEIICYSSVSELTESIDLAIISTNSDVRFKVITELANRTSVKNFILEKLLFQRKEDFKIIGNLFNKYNSKVWVNCTMRTVPVYHNLKNCMAGNIIRYSVTGSQYGLVTNAIHYIDHMAYLTDSYHYEADTTALVRNPIKSKRKGFLELNGTLGIRFKNGSTGSITCFADGNLPMLIEVYNDGFRFISRENEQKAWISKPDDYWKWHELSAQIPYQSQMTTKVAEDILLSGKCMLTPYEKSAELHLNLLESLKKFLNNSSSRKYKYYPFT